MKTSSLDELKSELESVGLLVGGRPTPLAASRRPDDGMIDRWARAAAFAEPQARAVAIWAIRAAAHAAGVVPCSIQGLYEARAREEWSNKTVPAMNLRGWSYQTCRAVFRAAQQLDAHLFIFEQAVGEALYAEQPPAEYTAAVLAAALREKHVGPVFLQADHDQVDPKAYARDPQGEIARLKEIMREQIAAAFFNIDIDASTIVDLTLPTVEDQQRLNAELTAQFTEFVRSVEPEGVTISLGAEIGEVGHENTTPEELHAFMATYPKALARSGGTLTGVSKISINSGTYHGGKVLPDGTLAAVNVDYATLETISALCRKHYGMAGAVQHGASTLPGEQLSRFPGSGAIEIHLALGFTNLTFDHPRVPPAFRDEIRNYVFANHAKERAAGETDAQFLYNVRKKAWKVMKARYWDLPDDVQADVMASLQAMFRDMFERMNIAGTVDLVRRHTIVRAVEPPLPHALGGPPPDPASRSRFAVAIY
ncbi:MAG: class II fructose-bisphosphate aldolase [Methylobacteriaceae bacterium]|nr:class II fructose-bisphosphate aldolase [Methylobacteriaceae bacterium]